MEGYTFSVEEEPIPSDQIAEPINVLNLIAVILAMIFCLFLFRIV